jgi:hypothetical protein
MKSKKVWIHWKERNKKGSPIVNGGVDRCIQMTHDSKRFLYAKFPGGQKILTLKDSSGNILDKLKLIDLYNKPK